MSQKQNMTMVNEIAKLHRFGKETGQAETAIRMIEDLVMANETAEWVREHATKAIKSLS